MPCELHAAVLPCPWPQCRAKAGVQDHIHDGQTARCFVCGVCQSLAWLWVPIGEPMPEIKHECKASA